MVECGADAVICQHSHCIGCYEQYEGGHIVYGQGNLHFVKPNGDKGWYTGLLIEMDIEDDIKLTFHPMVIEEAEGSVRRAVGEEANEIMTAFRERNEELKNGKWMDGWSAFCRSVPRYKNVLPPEATERDIERLSHFLDCEAHTDVLREYFKTWNHTNEK